MKTKTHAILCAVWQILDEQSEEKGDGGFLNLHVATLTGKNEI